MRKCKAERNKTRAALISMNKTACTITYWTRFAILFII